MATNKTILKNSKPGEDKMAQAPAPPKKVVVNTVRPPLPTPKAAPMPSYGRPMPVPKNLVRPPVAPPRTMKDPQQEFVRRGGKTGGARLVVPPGKEINPWDVMLMNPLGLVGGYPGRAVNVVGDEILAAIESYGLKPWSKEGAAAAAKPVGTAVAAGGKYTAQAIADAMRKLGGAAGNIGSNLGSIIKANPKLAGAAGLGAFGLGILSNGGFGGGDGGFGGGTGGGVPGGGVPFNQPYGGTGMSTGPAWTPDQGVYSGTKPRYGDGFIGPRVPGLDVGGGSFYNPTEEEILNSPFNQPYGGGLGVNPAAADAAAAAAAAAAANTNTGGGGGGGGSGGGVTDTGPGTNTGGGFFGPQSMADMMAMFTQMKSLFGDAGSAALDTIMGLYTELQKSMMDLQNKYIQSLIDAQKPVAPPVAPAPNLGPEAFVPPYISPGAQNGAYLELSDPGMGALYNMNPMYLQTVQQMLKDLKYTGAGVTGRYGERTYIRPGGPGSLAIDDAAFESPANYAGLPATERENAEAAMRYFFGEMGNSPRYQFPGRPQYPTRA